MKIPSNYLLAIGYAMLGGGATLTLGAINRLHRTSEMTEQYHRVLAPHFESFPSSGAYSGDASDDNQETAIQITSTDEFELRFLHSLMEGRTSADNTRLLAIGSVILTTMGVCLVTNSANPNIRKIPNNKAKTGPHG